MAKDAALGQIDEDLNNVLGRLEKLETRLTTDAKAVDGPVGGVEMREYQLQMLARLREIRDTMKKEGSSVEQLRQERDAAVAERDALKQQVAKLNYRVHHLKQHVVVQPQA